MLCRAVKGNASIVIPMELLEKYAQLGYTVYPLRGEVEANEPTELTAEA
jgi:hypothetical protein